MLLDSIVGQSVAISCLKQALESSRVHHAMRFEGPDGVGKETTAMAVAQALVCESSGSFACGVCSACKRAVSFTDTMPRLPMHPDVILVERGLYPAEAIGRSRPETQEISVDQVRSVILERIAFAPHEGKARVFIIRNAQQLSMSAANALLKTLEEPGQNTYFIMLVSHPAKLLNTIRSRSLRIRFSALNDEALTHILLQHDIAKEQALAVVPLSQGSVSAAMAMLNSESFELREQILRDIIDALGSSDANTCLTFAETYSRDKTLMQSHLEALAASFANCARQAVMQQRPNALIWEKRFQLTLDAMRAVEQNGSPALILENMILRMRAETG